nr:helix-turn-helix domain-containing protein [candidate division Zixibacteria bacterium]
MVLDIKEIGALLKKTREEQNREIEQLAEVLKIAERYLLAIEAGQIDELPSNTKIYYNLFVRSYARELGLDPDELLESMDTAEEKPEGDKNGETSPVSSTAGPERPYGETPLYKIGLWLAAVVVVIFVVVLILSRTGGKKGDVNETPSVTTGDALQIESAASDSIVTTGLPIDSMESKVKTDSVIPKLTVNHQPDSLKMGIMVNELSWVQVVADGNIVLEDNLDSGMTRTVRAAEVFLISLGNPNGVQLTLNGQLLRPLSPRGRPIKDVMISRENQKNYYLQLEE